MNNIFSFEELRFEAYSKLDAGKIEFDLENFESKLNNWEWEEEIRNGQSPSKTRQYVNSVRVCPSFELIGPSPIFKNRSRRGCDPLRPEVGGNIGFRITSRVEDVLNTAGLTTDSAKVFSKIGFLLSRLASLIFCNRHPERYQRTLNDDDPGIAEGLKICDGIISPQLFRKFLAEDDCRFLPEEQQFGLSIAA